MLRTLAALVAATSMTISFGAHGATRCFENTRFAALPADAQRHSMVGLAVAAAAGEDGAFADTEGRRLRFVGNAFLIELLPPGSLRRTAFFATARHNLAEICAAGGSGSPNEFRVVFKDDAKIIRSIPAVSVAVSVCSDISAAAQRASASESEVVYLPDVGIVVVDDLPGAGWLPMLLGTVDDGVTSSGVETLGSDLEPWSGPRLGLPNQSPHRSELPQSDELRAISGNFLEGASGSPYLGITQGRLVVLGIVTNSIPTSGLPMIAGNIVYSAPMMKAWIEKSWSTLQGSAFSLIFLSDTLVGHFDAEQYSPGVSSLFAQASQAGYVNSPVSRGALAELAANSQISMLAIRTKCQTADEQGNRFALKVMFCGRIASTSSSSQCLFNTDRYQNAMDQQLAIEAQQTTTPQARQLANIARETLADGSQGPSVGTAAIAATVLAATVDKAAPASGIIRSKLLFDLALAERAAGGSANDYLARLDEAVSSDSRNIQAARAFVDAAAKSDSTDAAAKGIQLIPVLHSAGNLDRLAATRTREMLGAVMSR